MAARDARVEPEHDVIGVLRVSAFKLAGTNQHVIATPRTYEMSGRLLLGLEPLRWLF